VRVTKATIAGADTRHALLAFIARHSCDLMVLASHERAGLRRWFGESIGEDTARSARVSTLFVRENHRGFVDRATGACTLANILLPVDAELRCAPSWRRIVSFAMLFEPRPRLHLLHVGTHTPVMRDEKGHAMDVPITLRDGPVVDTILAAAEEIGADLIAMPTAGHHGVFDALRGSTTQRVLHEARCPVLAVPVE
jgi:nucleotide-binding universal stress UspA family protein